MAAPAARQHSGPQQPGGPQRPGDPGTTAAPAAGPGGPQEPGTLGGPARPATPAAPALRKPWHAESPGFPGSMASPAVPAAWRPRQSCPQAACSPGGPRTRRPWRTGQPGGPGRPGHPEALASPAPRQPRHPQRSPRCARDTFRWPAVSARGPVARTCNAPRRVGALPRRDVAPRRTGHWRPDAARFVGAPRTTAVWCAAPPRGRRDGQGATGRGVCRGHRRA